MPRTYKPVPWHLRKRRPRGERVIIDMQSLSTGEVLAKEQPLDDDGLGNWIDSNWGETPQFKPTPQPKKPVTELDARYYVSATSGRRGVDYEFSGFGVFDALNYEYCVYASYTKAYADRRCQLMNDIHFGKRERYEVVPDPAKPGWWHVIDIFHADKPADIRWLWSARKDECEAQALELNKYDRTKR